MKILVKACEFKNLCDKLFTKKAQAVSKPLDLQLKFSLTGLASKLMGFDPRENPGVSIDVNQGKDFGAALNDAVQLKSIQDIDKTLKSIMNISNDGGGSIYSTAKELWQKIQAYLPKPSSVPSWLNKYVAENNIESKTPNWLSQYMDQEQASQEADEQIDNMQDSLDNRVTSVDDVLERSR